jgi:hypothetical protein
MVGKTRRESMPGFVCEAADQTLVGTTYNLLQVIALDGGPEAPTHLARDRQSRRRPQSSYWSHLDIVLDETSATVSTVSIRLFFDPTCDDPACPELVATDLEPGLTDTSLRVGVASLKLSVTSPASNQVTKKVYALVKVAGAGAPVATVKTLRLHWDLTRP